MAVKEYFRNRVMWKKPRMLSNDAPKENWLELFYDLELVAAAFALGTLFKVAQNSASEQERPAYTTVFICGIRCSLFSL